MVMQSAEYRVRLDIPDSLNGTKDALVVRMTENEDKLEDHRKRQIPEIPNPRRKQLPWQVVKQPSEDAPKPGRSAGCALSSLC
jgi:hypothetical protein